jgi:uncharacterized protein (DUF3820 family)
VKSFKSLNKGLCLEDKLSFGKYSDCRIRELIEHDPEYLQWMMKNKLLAFTSEVRNKLAAHLKALDDERHYTEEIKPYEDQSFDDVPY